MAPEKGIREGAQVGTTALMNEADLSQSGMGVARASARSGYMPVPLEQLLLNALKDLPAYLNTGKGGAERFTLYCSAGSRFTEAHRERLRDAGVKFIYLPMEC